MRQRIQSCIRRVNSANVSLGRKPDGNPAKLWPTVSQPLERRRRAALAGKVKRLIIEAGGVPLYPSHRARMGDRRGLVPECEGLIRQHSRACYLHAGRLWLG